MESHLINVSSKDIDKIWFHVEPFIIKAADYTNNQLTVSKIKKLLQESKQKLFIVMGYDKIMLCIIAEVIDYGHKTSLLIAAISGSDIKKYIHHLDDIKEWGKSLGCSDIEILGRRGWGKLLGIKPASYFYQERI